MPMIIQNDAKIIFFKSLITFPIADMKKKEFKGMVSQVSS